MFCEYRIINFVHPLLHSITIPRDEHSDEYIDNDYAEMMPLDDAMQR